MIAVAIRSFNILATRSTRAPVTAKLCDRYRVDAPVRIAIVGAGIGGLSLALALHEVGIEAEVFEQASKVRQLGVGINLQPHAIKVLAALGLLPALDRTGIRTRRMIYLTRRGQPVWDEPPGLEAGYDVPMFSIHRGKLQGVLYRAAVDRLGPNRIHTGQRLIGLREVGDGVAGRFERRADGETVEVIGDALIGAVRPAPPSLLSKLVSDTHPPMCRLWP